MAGFSGDPATRNTSQVLLRVSSVRRKGPRILFPGKGRPANRPGVLAEMAYTDAELAALLVVAIDQGTSNPSNAHWNDEMTMIMALCGWDRARTATAVEMAFMTSPGAIPTDADRAGVLLEAIVHGPRGLRLEALLAFLREWPTARGRRAFEQAARLGLIERAP